MAAVSKLDVTAAELRRAAKAIRAAAQIYLNYAQKVLAEANSMKNMWKGDSQVQFETQRQKNVKWFKEMYNLLMAYSAYLELMADKYEAYDADTAGKIRTSH